MPSGRSYSWALPASVVDGTCGFFPYLPHFAGALTLVSTSAVSTRLKECTAQPPYQNLSHQKSLTHTSKKRLHRFALAFTMQNLLVQLILLFMNSHKKTLINPGTLNLCHNLSGI